MSNVLGKISSSSPLDSPPTKNEQFAHFGTLGNLEGEEKTWPLPRWEKETGGGVKSKECCGATVQGRGVLLPTGSSWKHTRAADTVIPAQPVRAAWGSQGMLQPS